MKKARSLKKRKPRVVGGQSSLSDVNVTDADFLRRIYKDKDPTGPKGIVYNLGKDGNTYDVDKASLDEDGKVKIKRIETKYVRSELDGIRSTKTIPLMSLWDPNKRSTAETKQSAIDKVTISVGKDKVDKLCPFGLKAYVVHGRYLIENRYLTPYLEYEEKLYYFVTCKNSAEDGTDEANDKDVREKVLEVQRKSVDKNTPEQYKQLHKDELELFKKAYDVEYGTGKYDEDFKFDTVMPPIQQTAQPQMDTAQTKGGSSVKKRKRRRKKSVRRKHH